jgi:hypothetical protein
VLVLGLSALASLGIGDRVLAADPSPSPDAPLLELQAWLDEPLPSDAEPGTQLRIGALLWDRVHNTTAGASPTFVRLYPASGDGAPVEAAASPDWPGHVVATLMVPDGGPGRVEVRLRGTACTQDGCEVSDALFDLQGVGPPEGAPLPSIVDADIEPLVPTFTAGQATEVDVVLRPDVDWPDLARPGRLFVLVRQPRGDQFEAVPANLVDEAGRRYRATITLPEVGRYILEASMEEGRAAGDLFVASALAVEAVAPALASSDPSPSPTTGAPGEAADPGVLPLAIVAAVAVVASLGIIAFAIRPRP